MKLKELKFGIGGPVKLEEALVYYRKGHRISLSAIKTLDPGEIRVTFDAKGVLTHYTALSTRDILSNDWQVEFITGHLEEWLKDPPGTEPIDKGNILPKNEPYDWRYTVGDSPKFKSQFMFQGVPLEDYITQQIKDILRVELEKVSRC